MQRIEIQPTSLLLWCLFALLLSYIFGYLVWRLLITCKIYDNPNDRSSHKVPTPRGGGIGIMVVALSGVGIIAYRTSSITACVLVVTGVLLSSISFLDDRKSLTWWFRLGMHLLVGIIGSATIWGLDSAYSICAVFISTLLLAGYANSCNFMDGINGLATGHAIVCSAGTAIIAIVVGMPITHPAILVSTILTGAVAGFMPHNFPKARMFMGDVGSVPLGYILMFQTLWISKVGGLWLLLPLGALHTGFILDTSITFVRRLARADVWYKPHREHFYQRLVRSGRTHEMVTGLQLFIEISILAMLFSLTTMCRELLSIAMPIACLTWLIYYTYCEREFNMRSNQLCGPDIR